MAKQVRETNDDIYASLAIGWVEEHMENCRELREAAHQAILDTGLPKYLVDALLEDLRTCSDRDLVERFCVV
jgi:hypothetical protein